MSRPTICILRPACIDAKPRIVDWTKGYGDTWEYTEASRCSACAEAVVGREGDQHCEVVDGSTCSGSIGGEGPMMNYFYPIGVRDDVHSDEAAKVIVDLPLCIVTIEDDVGLALTGGGMNLTWEICEAHMLLGYLPPVHFANLPAMAEATSMTPKQRWIVAGCLRALTVTATRARNQAARLRERFHKKPVERTPLVIEARKAKRDRRAHTEI